MGAFVVVDGRVKSGGKVMGSLVVGVGVKVGRPVVVLLTPVVVLLTPVVVLLIPVVVLLFPVVVLAPEVVLMAAVVLVLPVFGLVGPADVVVRLSTGCWPATCENQE
jgi:hypothetical protein